MKKLILLSALFLVFGQMMANSDDKPVSGEQPAHRIIFQLSIGDTLAHKALMKQLGNITSVAPTTQIEVVCHGPGLDMLRADKSVVWEKIKLLAGPTITFMACEFSMKERNVTKDQIIPEAGFVKAGIIEIVSKQEQGWSYIKSGF